MAEISHLVCRNFFPRFEFKCVGTSEEIERLKCQTRRIVEWEEKGDHHEILEICCTACFADVAGRLLAGGGHGGSWSRSWSGRRPGCGWPPGLQLRLLPRLSVHLRPLRLLWPELVRQRSLYRRGSLVPRLGTSG